MRVTEAPPKKSVEFPIYQLMLENKSLKSLLSSASDMCKPTLNSDIKYNEQKIAALQGKKCLKLIEENIESLGRAGQEKCTNNQ